MHLSQSRQLLIQPPAPSPSSPSTQKRWPLAPRAPLYEPAMYRISRQNQRRALSYLPADSMLLLMLSILGLGSYSCTVGYLKQPTWSEHTVTAHTKRAKHIIIQALGNKVLNKCGFEPLTAMYLEPVGLLIRAPTKRL